MSVPVRSRADDRVCFKIISNSHMISSVVTKNACAGVLESEFSLEFQINVSVDPGRRESNARVNVHVETLR